MTEKELLDIWYSISIDDMLKCFNNRAPGYDDVFRVIKLYTKKICEKFNKGEQDAKRKT